LRIQTFGGLRAWLGDDPLALPPSRQARALLACLATADKPLHRARLCELLWENSSDPRGALRWCLSRLKAVLDAGGAARLIAEDDALSVSAEGWDVDARRLRELARGISGADTGGLEAAVARFSGPFLADLDLADSIRFESWRVGEEKSCPRPAPWSSRNCSAPRDSPRPRPAWAMSGSSRIPWTNGPTWPCWKP